MSRNNLRDVLSELNDAVTYLSEQCPVCSEVVKYLATQENEAAYLGRMAKDLELEEDSKIYSDAIKHLTEQEGLYDADGFVGLTKFGSSVEKLL